MFTELLKRPFPDGAVHWRVGARSKDRAKGMPLAYIDARDVMDRLDDVVGAGHWQDTYTETRSGRVLCSLTIDYPGIGPVTKTDGAGDTGTEGEKGAISDAFKRVAVKFGIGRYLYSMPSQWVELDQYGHFTPPKIPPHLTVKGYNQSLSRQIDKEQMQQSLIAALDALASSDGLAMSEVFGELNDREQSYLWAITSSKQKESIRSLLSSKAA